MLAPLIMRKLPYGVRFAVKNIRDEISIYAKHKNGVKKIKKLPTQNGLKLHFGCGPRPKEGYLNIDLGTKADVTLDLREPLPFRNSSSSFIYSEHFLEHLDYPEPVTSFLQECLRVLESGCVLSLVVPDIEYVLKSYVNGGTEEYYEAQKKWHPKWLKTQMEQVNYNFRQNNEHRFAYDFETLKILLENCGFVDVRRRSLDPSLDSPDRETGSLYVDCMKPTTS